MTFLGPSNISGPIWRVPSRTGRLRLIRGTAMSTAHAARAAGAELTAETLKAWTAFARVHGADAWIDVRPPVAPEGSDRLGWIRVIRFMRQGLHRPSTDCRDGPQLTSLHGSFCRSALGVRRAARARGVLVRPRRNAARVVAGSMIVKARKLPTA